MKKSYVKPQVVFEDFQLSANIAGNCGTADGVKDRATHSDGNSCQYQTSFGMLYTNENSCDFTTQDDIATNLCYHIPDANYRFFAS